MTTVRRAALVAAAALTAVSLARLPAAWASGNALNHVSGVWLTLADDLTRGTFYRPLHAAGAFGGTRYFPLVFTLDAALARAGAPLLAAGVALSLAAALLAAAGIAALLRASGAARSDAAAGGALALAGLAAQRALADARGDLLPVALSAWALAAVARPGRSRAGPAAALLVLAFAAKPTALAAAGAAIAVLALRGARRDAALLAGLVAGGAAAVVAVTELASSGRFLAALAASAAPGAGPRTLLAAPVRLAAEAALEDPTGLLLAVLAGVEVAAAAPALARAGRDRGRDPRLLPAVWVVAAWLGALVTYAVPGTGVNHLVELEVASATLLGTCVVARGRAAGRARAGVALAAAAGTVAALGLWREDRTSSRLAEIRAVVRALPPSGRVFSEDPLVPLLDGDSPLVLDPFALRAVASADPGAFASLATGLGAGAFPAVVLLADLDAPDAERWYARGNLGPSLVARIRGGYRPSGAVGRYHLYVPRRAADGTVPRDAGVARRVAPR